MILKSLYGSKVKFVGFSKADPKSIWVDYNNRVNHMLIEDLNNESKEELEKYRQEIIYEKSRKN